MRRTAIVILVIVLAGCNFSRAKDETPTPGVTIPVVLVNTAPPTLTLTPEFTYTPTIPATFTPAAPPPTLPPTATPTNTTVPTPVPVATTPAAPPPTSAPAVADAAVPARSVAAAAKVCETCDQLRLRESPGTSGEIVAMLAANTSLSIIGRTGDNAWVQVTLADGRNGWVASQYLEISIDLNTVGVTGMAKDVVVASGSGAVFSGISSNARQIYLNGQSKGNRASVFSKVGDSVTYSWAYGYPLASDVELGTYDYLSPALSFFSGPNARGENCFSASPIAAYPGWTTADVLRPGGAVIGACGSGETPLECEYRTARPAVALILLGTNDVAQSVSTETFRANLQRIVDISVDMGVIPVLSTMPPFPVLDGSARAFNEIIVATARANDVPLWDYYRALNSLPNRGLSPDNVHPSEAPDNKDAYFDAEHLQYGFTVRNLGTLEILYELWRQVLYDAGTAPPPAPPPGPKPTVVDIGPVDVATYSCPGSSPVVLTVGGQGRVTPGLPNKVRNAPGYSGVQIGTIPGEGVFDVTGGPHCADGMSWWQINYNGLIGWTAGGTASENWVEASP